jgi:hypothetical protein
MPSEESADPHNGFGKSYQIRKKLYLIPTFRLMQSIVGKKKRGQSTLATERLQPKQRRLQK